VSVLSVFRFVAARSIYILLFIAKEFNKM